MPKIKILSGKDVIRIFEHFGFSIIHQKGSHVKLRRIFMKQKQTLTIPNHKELDTRTLKAIYNQSLRYIPESEILPYFFQV